MIHTNTTRRIPVEAFPPGEYLQDELNARGLSLATFAAEIGREPASLRRLIEGRAQLTADIALQLEESLGLDAQYWLNLETAYRLARCRARRTRTRRAAR